MSVFEEPTSEEDVVQRLREVLGEALLEAKIAGRRRVFVTVDRRHYRTAIIALKEMGFDFLSAITGVDAGDQFEVIAHLGRRISAAVRALVPKEDASIESIVDIYPGALYYERETWEMLGIHFKGNPKLERTFLPESWPLGVHPLRKEREQGDG